MAQPEKLNLWDRLFNRYRKEILEEGKEKWKRWPYGAEVPSLSIAYVRTYVKYKVIDRLTGSETIEMEYLN